MTSAKDVHGEIYRALGIFLLSVISYLLSFFVPSGALSNFLNQQIKIGRMVHSSEILSMLKML